MAPLSPAAQAVLDALLNTPVNSRQVCDGKAPQIKLAAALRAASDIPSASAPVPLARRLRAIATELEQAADSTNTSTETP
jgi:hypothetical protein